ncbi:MAG TPA: sigma 54-interacting transcriptional regulator [Thermoanaerobaculia bacterium]|nr:sigma 54-interacting transcriptional regulator [Thermoanaerobaculia bacterium]
MRTRRRSAGERHRRTDFAGNENAAFWARSGLAFGAGNRTHRLSHRADQPFVDVNCAAIPEELIAHTASASSEAEAR